MKKNIIFIGFLSLLMMQEVVLSADNLIKQEQSADELVKNRTSAIVNK